MADGQTNIRAELTGLELLRAPFPPNCISKLPKPTKAQTDAVKADFKKGVRCRLCGSWHHPDVVHLDYVGHAALTDRLLDADPEWTWEPAVMDGLPNPVGGMWIKLTVCGVSRIGYGSADGKTGGDAIKEIIGDALRNAAMRFGAALDLWHKGDLHPDEGEVKEPAEQEATLPPEAGSQNATKANSRELFSELQKQRRACSSFVELQAWAAANAPRIKSLEQGFYKTFKADYASELAAFQDAEKAESERENQQQETGLYDDIPV